MDRLLTPHGGPVQVRSQFQFLQDAFKDAIKQMLSNRTAVEPMFIISGVNATENVDGQGDVNVSVSDGVICFNGEPMPVPPQSVTRTPDQVAYFVVDEVGVDTTPVIVNGQSMNVKMHRYAKLTVGSNYPSAATHCKIDAPTMDEINKELVGAGQLRKRDIVEISATTSELYQWYDSNGLGIPGTPGSGRAICNGATHVINGTEVTVPDKRGLVSVQATANYPGDGGSQSLPANVSEDYLFGQLYGTEKVALAIEEMPQHDHVYKRSSFNYEVNGGNQQTVSTFNTNDTTDPAGGDPNDGNNTKPHENRQPTLATVFVVIL